MTKRITINEIEELLDFSIPEIKTHYDCWDRGDCSLIGLIEILLFQEILKHKTENGAYYDTDYDIIHLRYK